MLRSLSLFALFSSLVATSSTQAQTVVTFSSARAIQTVQQACPGTPATSDVRVRRNADGSIVSIIREGKGETVLYSGGVQCNPLQEMVMDVWRGADGSVLALVQQREEGRKLVIGESEFRGFRYDVDPSGTYFVLSQGESSSVAAVSRPFRKLLTLDLDAQRIFAQGRRIVVLGNSPASGRLEYRILQPSEAGLAVVGQGPVGSQPAGIRVLDFDPSSSNVLLSGANSAGQIAFALVNIANGTSRVVQPQNPGDDQALFLENSGVRRRLTGSNATATGGTGFKIPFFNR